MNAIDIAIICFVAIAAAFGFVRGFWLTAFEYVGVIGGFVAAALFAPALLESFALESPALRLAVALLLLGGGATAGSAVAQLAGEPARRLMRTVRVVGAVDALGGAALTTVVALATVWYLGLSLSRGPSEALAQAVQQSAVLRRVDSV